MGRQGLGLLPTSHGAFTATQVRSNFLPRIETIRYRPAWIRRRRGFWGPGGEVVFTRHAPRGNTLARSPMPFKSWFDAWFDAVICGKSGPDRCCPLLHVVPPS
jgi:hypothetical protein